MNEIDKNLIVDSKINEPDYILHDVRNSPFEVYGLYNYRTEPTFKRLPDEIGLNTNSGVKSLYLQTSGGRVRFSTDSSYIAIKAKYGHVGRYPHMPLLCSAGFDLYEDFPATGASRYLKSFMPEISLSDTLISKIAVGNTGMMRYFTINFPTYSNVSELSVALARNAQTGEGMKYLNKKPVIFYGSSITQGACASRPGNIYPNVFSRRVGIDYINLGFSGNGKAEDIIVNYMANLNMSVFVSDYDHNAPSPEYLEETHEKMYKIIRAKNPELPYIIISMPDFDRDYNANVKRRSIIMKTYENALAADDKKVYFIDGEGIFKGDYEDMCTVDSTHPNDLGFSLMARAFISTFNKVMRENNVLK